MGRPSSWSPKSEPAEAGTAPGTNGMEPGFGVGNQAANSVSPMRKRSCGSWGGIGKSAKIGKTTWKL